MRTIPKIIIKKVGTFVNGIPFDWEFDGASHPESVGYHLGVDGTELWGGYNIEELKLIVRIKIMESDLLDEFEAVESMGELSKLLRKYGR